MAGRGTLFEVISRVSAAACVLPEGLGRSVSAGIGMLLARLWVSERHRQRETLERIYHRMGRPLPMPVDRIIDRAFIHFALTCWELLRFPQLPQEDLGLRMSFHGRENLETALARGKGVILAVPHLGNWELLGSSIARAGYSLHSFYLAQKEDGLGAVLDHLRQFSGIILHDRDRGGIGALKALRKGESLGMLPDQDGGNHGVYTDFLGHWVSLPPGPANWSLKTGAALVPLFSLREGWSARYRTRFFPALPEEGEGTHVQKVVARTRRLASWMEGVILAHPDQYLWFYDRFKPRHHLHLAGLKRDGVRMRTGEAVYGVPEDGQE